MEQRRRKRILYIICFSCLALIDFVRGSQKWEYWATAINLTGVFVSIVMMSHFCWKKESPKPYFAWTGIWMIGSLIGHGIWKEYSKTRFTSQYWAAAIAILFVGIVAVRVWRERKDIFRNFRKIHILSVTPAIGARNRGFSTSRFPIFIGYLSFGKLGLLYHIPQRFASHGCA